MERRDQERVVFFKRADTRARLKADGNYSLKREKVMMQKKERNTVGAVSSNRQEGCDLVYKWRVGLRAVVVHPQ